MNETTSHAAAFWDVDRTMIRGSALLALLRPLYRHGYIQPRTLGTSIFRQSVFSRLGYSDAELESGANLAASLAKGMSATELEIIGKLLVPKIIVPRIYPQAQTLMRRHHKQGDLNFIVSSAPREIVDPLAAAIGAAGSAGTVADSVDGVYAGTVSVFMHGQAKADAVKELAAKHNLDLDRSYAYADSAGDTPMLEMVGNPFCVNPDRKLREIADARGWPCLTFTMSGKLRSPVSQELRHLVTTRVLRRPPAPERLSGIG